MSNSVNIGLNMTGNIVDRFSQLSDKVQEVEKFVKKLGPEFKNLAGTGIGSNPKLHSIISGTDFKGGFDGIQKSIKKNKIKAYDGGILGQKELAGILDTRNALKSAQLGAKASGYKDIEKMLKAPVERYEALLKAMDVSLTRVKAMDLKDGDLKSTEKAIKKFVDDANKLILTTENSFNGMGKTAAGAFKKANPSKTAAGTKIRGKDYSYDYDRYQSDAKYAKQVDEFKLYYQRKADNYGDIGKSALQNAALKGTKVFGGTNGNYNGFWSELAQGFKNGINEGLKDFDIGELLSNTIKKGGKSRRQNKVLDKFGYDSEFILDTQAAMKTKSFQQFAKQQREKFGDLGKQMTDRDIMRGATKSDRANLLKQIKANKEIDFSQLTKGDKSKVFAGLVNNKGATSMMGGLKVGGISLTAVAGVSKLAEAAKQLGTECLKAFEGVEQLKTQLGVVFGSTTQSDKMFSDIEAYAKKSPFGVENMTQQAILLKQSGVYASELMNTMKRIGDISSGNNEKMKSVSQVYARVMSSQTVTARDMRQLSTAGVPSYTALADAMGIDRGQIRSKLQAGQVSSFDFQKMIEKLTNKGGMFYAATEKGAQTFAARKQNLADAKQMAQSSVGEWIAKLGSDTGRTTDGYYAGVIGILENIYSKVEDVFSVINKEKDVEAVQKLQDRINLLEDTLKDPREHSDNRAFSVEGRAEIEEEIENLRKALPAAMAKAFSSGDDLWKREQRVEGSLYEGFKKGTGVNFEVRDERGLLDKEATIKKITDQYKYIQEQLNGDNLWETSVGVDYNDIYQNFVKNNPSASAKHISQAQASALKDMGLGDEGAGVSLEDIIASFEKSINPAKYAVEHFYSEIINAAQQGADDLDNMINNTKDTFDKQGNVNFGKEGAAGYGSQHLMREATDDYQRNSPVWQMSWKDQKAYWDEQAKKEINMYSSKTKKGKDEEGNDIYSFAELTAEEMNRAMDLLVENQDQIGILAHPENLLNEKGELTEQSKQDIQDLLKNFEELAQVAENSGGDKTFGEPFVKNLKEIQNILNDKDFGKNAKENLEKFNEIFATGLVGTLNDQLEYGNLPPDVKKKIEAMKKNTIRATNNKSYNDRTDDINRRKQASLRSHVISQITGVSAERVDNSWNRKTKENAAMNAYINNFSQRQMFAQLGKALMQNGTELKDVARAMQEGKNGQKYGMYDWNKSTSSIEEQAAQKNIATQEALISAYQQQIDALQELTVGSIATRDQWDNLGSLSAQLGVAFELSAKTLADGTVQFTDATIQSAHKMMEELNLKKFNQQMSTILNSTIDKIRGEQRDTGFKSMVISGSIPSIGRVKTADVESYAGVMSAQAKEISKTDKTTLVNSLLEKARSVYGSEKEAKATAEIFTKALGDEAKKIAVKENVRAAYSGGPASFSSVDKLAKERMQSDFNKTGKSPDQFKDWALQTVNWGDKNQSLYNKYYALALRDSGYKDWPTINVERNFTPENTSASGTNFRLASVNGQKESAYIKSMPEKLDKGYGLEGFSKKDAEDLVDKILSALDAGKLPKEYEGLFLVLTGLQDGAEGLKAVIEDNTQAQIRNAAMQEVFAHNEKLFEFLGSKGVLGEDTKTLENSKAFSEMNPNNPLLHKINSPFQDELLEFNGVGKNVDYKTYRRWRVGDMMDLSMSDKNGNNLLDEDETANKLKDDEKTHAAMRNYLTSGTGKRFAKELYKNAPDEMKKELGSNFGEFQEKLKGMDDKELDGMLSHFKGGGEAFDGVKSSLEDVIAKMQEAEEHSAMFQDKLTQLGNSIKGEALNGAMNAINTGFTKAGDLAYKLQNNLIEGADATMEMKKALAGVAATMLENIGASMTKTGLDIAGGAAQDRNWGMVAAGLALAVAGGAASFGGGMLSAFASDNNKGNSDEAEDQLARLEDLKDNLAELLKQAKDDAIYYETNLRQKQAVAFNDAVSSTSVNDAIITPNGVVNTAPDDYIMAMKDPTHLMGKGGGATNVSFSIVNESGTPMTVTGSETRQNGDTTEITAIVNAIVQKSMNDGEYDDVMAGMQLRQRGSQISS